MRLELEQLVVEDRRCGDKVEMWIDGEEGEPVFLTNEQVRLLIHHLQQLFPEDT